MQKNIVRIVPFRTYNLNSMSERLSQTAGETVDRTQETLLKRAMGFLSTPAGKIIGGAAIVLGAAAATQKAAADTVACVTKPTVGAPTLIVDGNIQAQTTDGDSSKTASSGPDSFGSTGMDILGRKIYTAATGSSGGGARYNIYGADLTKDRENFVPNQGDLKYFITGTDLRVKRVGGDLQVLKIDNQENPTEFVNNGMIAGIDLFLNEIIGNESYLFLSTADGMRVVPRADLDGNNNSVTPSDPIKIDSNEVPYSGGAFFIDNDGHIVYSYESAVQGYGFTTIAAANPTGWRNDIGLEKFIQTDYKLKKGCSDKNGYYYFLTEPAQEDGKSYMVVYDSLASNMLVGGPIEVNPKYADTLNPMTPLSEGVLLVEEGEALPVVIDKNGNKHAVTADKFSTDGNPIYRCAVFQEDPFPTDLCENFNPAEHEDENPCTEASCNQDTGDINQLPGNEGEPCDDKNPDTDPDKCEAGTCIGTPIVTDVIEGEDVTVEPTPDAGSDVIDEGVAGDEGDPDAPDAPDAVEPDDIIGDDAGPDAPDAIDPKDTIPENDYRPEIKELPTDVGEENDYRGEDVIKDVSIEDIINIDANNPDIVTEEGKGGGGCSSVPNGVNDTRTGVAAVMLAALAALSGSRWRRREDEVKLNK